MSYNQLLKGRCSQPFYFYHITICTKDRHPYFADLYIARLLVAQMKLLHDNEYVISFSFALMPDHLHWQIQLTDKLSLPKVLNLLKGRSAYAINRCLGERGRVWQKGYYDRAIRSDADLKQIARYIVSNPLKDGLVTSLANYSHWDAVWV